MVGLPPGDAGGRDLASGGDAARPGDAAPPGDAATPADGAAPLGKGWLYTKGAGIFVSDGAGGGTPWMGRGVNVDDLFLCGYNNTLWMGSADQTVETIVASLIANWKPTFVRISLGMDSFPTVVSWLSNPGQYKTPMTGVIQAIGANPGVYVLVTLRSDASMILQDQTDGDPEATGIPSDATNTPDKNKFPSGTDAVYQALVDSFASAPFVVFGVTNEPGGNKQSSATLAKAMSHAVDVIRAEEDKLGVPHHLVSVQGNAWTSDISYYVNAPLPQDNVVYEVHGYPPQVASYTQPSLPVIIGEYGSLDANSAPAFYTDVEKKQIPNLAWDFDPYSNCAPDLLNVTADATKIQPSAWGMIVQSYLLAH
jgi:hypothetical protein